MSAKHPEVIPRSYRVVAVEFRGEDAPPPAEVRKQIKELGGMWIARHQAWIIPLENGDELAELVDGFIREKGWAFRGGRARSPQEVVEKIRAKRNALEERA